MPLLVLLVIASCQTKNSRSFDNSQKDATQATIAANNQLLTYLPFNDSTDYANALRGFIDTKDVGVIMNDDGVVYSMNEFEFLDGPTPSTANPSLWRQSYLNSINGLFRVYPEPGMDETINVSTLNTGDIFQVRGFDVSNISLVKGENGWIVIDPVSSKETALAALRLVRENYGNIPVLNIIISHSHLDHFGGIQGVMDYNDEIGYAGLENLIEIYVPKGFFEEAVSENVMAGSAMGRRATYMYGNLLNKNAKGTLAAVSTAAK